MGSSGPPRSGSTGRWNYFDAVAAGNGRPALHLVEEDGAETIRSFAELSAASNRVAHTHQSHCRNRVAPYRRIRRIEFAVLPKTISGKIRRVELRQAELARRAAGERVAYEFFEEDL